MSTRFVAPPKKEVVTQLPESLIRKRARCSAVHQSYVMNLNNDKLTLETSILAVKHPDNVQDALLTLSRVKLSPGLFELDEKGTIDTKFKVREALVYSVARRVMSPQNPETVALSHCTITQGIFSRPYAEITRGDQGEVIKAEVKFWRNTFYIPFTEANVKKVLEDHNYQYRNTVIAVAKAEGELWNNGKTWNIQNLKEWMEVEADTLIESNQAGLLTAEYGGHIRFLTKQQAKRQMLEEEITEYKEKHKTENKNVKQAK